MAFNQPLAGLIEPVRSATWRRATAADRLAFYEHAGELAEAALRAQLGRGVGATGRAMVPRKHPRADGADGPVMTPHGKDSRTRRLLDSRATPNGVTLFWHSGIRRDQRTPWATILGYHAAGEVRGAPVRDVRLSGRNVGILRAKLARWWDGRHPAKSPAPAPKPTPTPPAPATRPAVPRPAPPPKLPVPAPALTPVQRAKILALPRNARPLAYRDLGADVTFAPPRAKAKAGGKPAKATAPPPAEAPPVPAPAPAPLPDIAAKLAAYTEGDRKVRELAAAAESMQRLKADMARHGAKVDRVLARLRKATADDDRAVIRAELNMAQEDYTRAYHGLQSAMATSRETAARILGRPAAPIEIADPVFPMAGLAEGPRRAAEQAVAHLQSLVARGKLDGPLAVAWHRADTGRAYSAGPNVFLDDGTQAGTAVHELGHVLENMVPGWREAAQAFLRHRVGDEPLRPFTELWPNHGYRPDERGRKDRFEAAFGEHYAWYVGKHYGGYSSEITAMGLEKLHADPLNFAAEDPEYVKFLLGVLDGSLR